MKASFGFKSRREAINFFGNTYDTIHWDMILAVLNYVGCACAPKDAITREQFIRTRLDEVMYPDDIDRLIHFLQAHSLLEGVLNEKTD